jgi:hypothetical protein
VEVNLTVEFVGLYYKDILGYQVGEALAEDVIMGRRYSDGGSRSYNKYWRALVKDILGYQVGRRTREG